MTEPEDQVPRRLAYEQAYPGATFLAPDANNSRWRMCYKGKPVNVRGHDYDLMALMDYLEEAGDPRAVGADPLTLRWRHVSRQVYAQIGDEPSDHDLYIGAVETSVLAGHVCAAHNGAVIGAVPIHPSDLTRRVH